MEKYSVYFEGSLWQVFVWCLSNMSMGIQKMKQPKYECFNQFIFFKLNDAVSKVKLLTEKEQSGPSDPHSS